MKQYLEKYRAILLNIDILAGIAGIGIGAFLGLMFFSETVSDVLAVTCIFGCMFAGVAMILNNSQ
ncbi:MAG: hypothetical protein VW378_02565 [bacterium]